ncbi:MAG: hypothetical protein R3F55_21415 [Alphaproteobacteria bacterium]
MIAPSIARTMVIGTGAGLQHAADQVLRPAQLALHPPALGHVGQRQHAAAQPGAAAPDPQPAPVGQLQLRPGAAVVQGALVRIGEGRRVALLAGEPAGAGAGVEDFAPADPGPRRRAAHGAEQGVADHQPAVGIEYGESQRHALDRVLEQLAGLLRLALALAQRGHVGHQHCAPTLAGQRALDEQLGAVVQRDLHRPGHLAAQRHEARHPVVDRRVERLAGDRGHPLQQDRNAVLEAAAQQGRRLGAVQLGIGAVADRQRTVGLLDADRVGQVLDRVVQQLRPAAGLVLRRHLLCGVAHELVVAGDGPVLAVVRVEHPLGEAAHAVGIDRPAGPAGDAAGQRGLAHLQVGPEALRADHLGRRAADQGVGVLADQPRRLAIGEQGAVLAVHEPDPRGYRIQDHAQHPVLVQVTGWAGQIASHTPFVHATLPARHRARHGHHAK